MKLEELMGAVRKIDGSVTQSQVEAVLDEFSLTAGQVKPTMIQEIADLAKNIGGQIVPTESKEIEVTKPQLAKPVAQSAAIAPIKPVETAPQVSQTAADSTAATKKASLLAEIENLKAQKELADLEKQALALKAELLAAQAEVLTVGTDLAEQENSHKLWSEAAPGLVDMAAQNGKLIAEDAIGRQKAALGELRTVSQSIKLNSEIAVEALRQQQVVQDNRWQEIRNKTPQLLPAMSQDNGNGMRTVETVAV